MGPIADYATIAVAVVAVGYIVGGFLFKKDDQKEDRQRAYITLSSELKSYGLVKLPELLIDLAVDDYSAVFTKAKTLVELINGGYEPLAKEFDAVWDSITNAKLQDPAQVALLEQKIAAVKSPAATVEAKPAVVAEAKAS